MSTDKSLINPADVNRESNQVLQGASLTKEHKMEILKQWEYNPSEPPYLAILLNNTDCADGFSFYRVTLPDFHLYCQPLSPAAATIYIRYLFCILHVVIEKWIQPHMWHPQILVYQAASPSGKVKNN